MSVFESGLSKERVYMSLKREGRGRGKPSGDASGDSPPLVPRGVLNSHTHTHTHTLTQTHVPPGVAVPGTQSLCELPLNTQVYT